MTPSICPEKTKPRRQPQMLHLMESLANRFDATRPSKRTGLCLGGTTVVGIGRGDSPRCRRDTGSPQLKRRQLGL